MQSTGHKVSACKKKNDRESKSINIVLSKKFKSNSKRKYVDVKINGQTINSLLDTGSDIFIIDELTWKNIGQQKLQNTKKIT